MDRATLGTRLSWLLTTFALSSLAGCQSSPTRSGWYAYQAGDHDGALAEWLPAAQGGDAEAQYLVGLMYDEGQGTAPDRALAARWYRAAAEQGCAPAQNKPGPAVLRRARSRAFARAALAGVQGRPVKGRLRGRQPRSTTRNQVEPT